MPSTGDEAADRSRGAAVRSRAAAVRGRKAVAFRPASRTSSGSGRPIEERAMPDVSLRRLRTRRGTRACEVRGRPRDPAVAYDLSSFTDELKHEAFAAKDAWVESAKSKAQSTVNGMVEDLKAKAAANPAAALAIGAGIAWRVIQNPPIATALVGLGLYSLLRTDATRPPYGVQPDYIAEGRERLKEQVADLAASARETAAQAGDAASAKAAELADLAKDKAREWSESSLQAARRLQQEAQEATENAYGQAGGVMNQTIAQARATVANTESRDTLLLGAAGLAVAAALGIACQRRSRWPPCASCWARLQGAPSASCPTSRALSLARSASSAAAVALAASYFAAAVSLALAARSATCSLRRSRPSAI